MILVILGTHSQPFDRLAEGIDKYAATTDEKIVVQMGVSNYPMQHVSKHFAFCSKEDINGYMGEANLLVMQGGWGGMEEAIDLGKRIVAVPRIEGAEHIHNQEQLVRKLDNLGCVIGCYDINKLADCIEKAKNFNFMPLQKGSATEIIAEHMKQWFDR